LKKIRAKTGVGSPGALSGVDKADPQSHSGELDEAEEAAGGAVIPGENATTVLQAVDATLDAIAQGIDGLLHTVLDKAIALDGDLRLTAPAKVGGLQQLARRLASAARINQSGQTRS